MTVLPFSKSSMQKAVFALGLALLLLGSCTKRPVNNSTTLTSPIRNFIRFEYAVYILPGYGNNAEAVLRQIVNKKHPQLQFVSNLPEEPNGMFLATHLEKDVRHNYVPPNINSLRYSGEGLTPDQQQALQKSRIALIMDFAHPKGQVWAALRQANVLAEEVARKTNGLLWDEETREVFSPDEWHKTRVATWTSEVPEISGEIVIHTYDEDEYARAITLGMSKFGLPDVVVQRLPWSAEGQVGDLINNFSQFMAEGGKIPSAGRFMLDFRVVKNQEMRNKETKSTKSNGTGKGCLTLKDGKWEEGDPKNRLIELAADAYPGNDNQEK